jgi:hypothetical protein
LAKWDVAAPYDFMTYGLGGVWIWGGGDGGYPNGKLQVVDPATDATSTRTNAGRGFGGVAFLDGHAWVTAGPSIWELDAGGQHKLAEVQLGVGITSPDAIYATGGQLVTQTSPTSMQYVVPNRGGVGAHLGVAQAVVDATEQLLGVESPDTLLVSTGGDVERWSRTGNGSSDHALLNASVFAVTVLPNRDLLVVTGATDSTPPALWIVLTSAPDGTLCETCVRKIADGVEVLSIVANPNGGADFVLADGTAEHWQP